VRLPEALFNRAGDNWGPLFRIAQAIGGHWSKTIERAALKALSSVIEDDNDLPMCFLRDVYRLLHPEPKTERDPIPDPLPHIWTQDIVTGLLALDDPSADWARAYRGAQITNYSAGRMLSHWLRPDRPKQIRVGTQNLHGVYTSELRDAFARHLGKGEIVQQPPKQPATSATSATDRKGVQKGSEKSVAELNSADFSSTTSATKPKKGAGWAVSVADVAEAGDDKFSSATVQITDNNGEFNKVADVAGEISPARVIPPPASGKTQPRIALTAASRTRLNKLNGAAAATEKAEQARRASLPREVRKL
jgi:hypothetical protein